MYENKTLHTGHGAVNSGRCQAHVECFLVCCVPRSWQ